MADNDSLSKLIACAVLGPPFIAYAWRWAWRIARWKGGHASFTRLVLFAHGAGLALAGIVALGWIAVWAIFAGKWPRIPGSGTGTVNHPYDYGILVIAYFVVSSIIATAIADRTPEKSRPGGTRHDKAALASEEF